MQDSVYIVLLDVPYGEVILGVYRTKEMAADRADIEGEHAYVLEQGVIG